MVDAFDRDVAGRVLGRSDVGQGGSSGQSGGPQHLRLHGRQALARRQAGGAGRGVRSPDRRLRIVEDPVGRDQPLPAQRRGHRPDLRRQQAQPSGGLHLGPVGLAGIIRRKTLAGDEEVLWNPGQQLRGGGAVETRSAPAPYRPAARAAIRHRRTSTTRRSAMRSATYGTSISIPRTSRSTRCGRIGRESRTRRSSLSWEVSARRDDGGGRGKVSRTSPSGRFATTSPTRGGGFRS